MAQSDPSKSHRPRTAKDADPGPAVRWILTPEEHDYPAAESYLSLLMDPEVAHATAIALHEAQPAHFKAKDILRAARLDLLPRTNPHVASNLRKIGDGKPLSPVLMVRGAAHAGHPALIADGYHRVCASYWTDENTDIPVRIVDVPEPQARGAVGFRPNGDGEA